MDSEGRDCGARANEVLCSRKQVLFVKLSRSWVSRQAGPIGLDLGTRMVRMLQLARQDGRASIIACAQRTIPLGVTGDEELEHRQAEAVESMLRAGDFRGRDVVTTLTWDDLNIRSVRLPPMPDARIPDAIRRDAVGRPGEAQDQIEVRFLPAGDVRAGTELHQEVIVLTTAHSTIEAHVRKLARLGLRPTAIDAAPCALFRGFERLLRRDADAGKVNVYVEIGYTSSRVLIARGPELMVIKPIPVGGRRFDQLVRDQLELSLEEAAQLRVRVHALHVAELSEQADRLPPDERVSDEMRRTILDALRPALDQLSKEISLCLRYYSTTFRGGRPESISVLGGEACNCDILRFLSDRLTVPCSVGRPMRNTMIEAACAKADRRTGQPEWAMALGLALKPAQRALAVSS